MSESAKSLAILFADISGSTKLYGEFGNERAREMVTACLGRLRSTVDDHDGRLVQIQGDGMLCTFPDANAAVRAATEMRDGQKDQPLSIHAGIHLGSVYVEGESLYGDAVNVASRIADIAKTGEIVTTQDTVDALSPELRKLTRLIDKVAVKGKPNPIHVYLVVSAKEDATEYRPRIADSAKQLSGLEIKYKDSTIVLSDNKPEFVIGRVSECNLVIDNHMISRRHATIECTRGKFFLVDHSTNGTYVHVEQDEPVVLRRDLVQLLRSGVISLGMEPDGENEDLIQFRQIAPN